VTVVSSGFDLAADERICPPKSGATLGCLTDERNGRFVGSYLTNISGQYTVRLVYTEPELRRCVDCAVVVEDGEACAACRRFAVFAGAPHTISGGSYTVVVYADKTLPEHCEATVLQTTHRNRCEIATCCRDEYRVS
jgi:hypothetical protein